MHTMHIFAGIGGGLLADRILGHTPLVAVEWEPYACQILRERVADGWFPGMHVWEGDVQLFDPSEYTGRVDCIHAGFPCQDISVAGKQAGIAEGTRSGLYREVLRIAGIVRPPYIFLENVAAITSKGLDQVLKDLAEMGYDSKWACLRASDVGAPHHRDRWWCLAQSISERTGSICREADSDRGWNTRRDEPTLRQAHRENGSSGTDTTSSTSGDVVDTRREGILQRGFDVDAPEKVQFKGGVRGDVLSGGSNEEGTDVADTECVGQQGQGEHVRPCGSKAHQDREATRTVNCGEKWPGYWDIEPDVGRVAHGVPNRVQRLEGLGNAQVPLQAAVAFHILYTS